MSYPIVMEATFALLVFAAATYSAWTLKKEELVYRAFVCVGWGAIVTQGTFVIFRAVTG